MLHGAKVVLKNYTPLRKSLQVIQTPATVQLSLQVTDTASTCPRKGELRFPPAVSGPPRRAPKPKAAAIPSEGKALGKARASGSQSLAARTKPEALDRERPPPQGFGETLALSRLAPRLPRTAARRGQTSRAQEQRARLCSIGLRSKGVARAAPRTF